MLDPTTPLAHLPLAVVDFEATGFPGPDAHIVEVAVVHIDLAPGSVPTVGLSSLVRPPPVRATACRCGALITQGDRALGELVYQPLTSRQLALEDGREIVHNLGGFLGVLAGWKRREREREAAARAGGGAR